MPECCFEGLWEPTLLMYDDEGPRRIKLRLDGLTFCGVCMRKVHVKDFFDDQAFARVTRMYEKHGFKVMGKVKIRWMKVVTV